MGKSKGREICGLQVNEGERRLKELKAALVRSRWARGRACGGRGAGWGWGAVYDRASRGSRSKLLHGGGEVTVARGSRGGDGASDKADVRFEKTISGRTGIPLPLSRKVRWAMEKAPSVGDVGLGILGHGGGDAKAIQDHVGSARTEGCRARRLDRDIPRERDPSEVHPPPCERKGRAA